jgi:protein-lysine N-methyltransferase EEF2KMT
MFDDCHLRLTLSRGTKVTSSMNPVFNIFGCVLLIVPEWKPVGNQATYNNEAGIKLVTAYNRRNTSSCLDSKIHHCNLINNSTSAA